ncbi:hypothetical protein [Paenibacillus ginsengarvi]|uniref:Uncharacterized protein n=1 Tax=Paenibacillus ginsengarvi TaxID=400777 RepID=A0A3B0CCG3_9BACL|nr:hypothetical protein [Paenibacillus ginsengarvi]RKN83723.1 hypothetical protein D7M11_16110 [Paenibacillus ginsengarvi]
MFEAPKHPRKSEAKLKGQQKVVSRKQRGSSRRRKAVLTLARQLESYVSHFVDCGIPEPSITIKYKIV